MNYVITYTKDPKVFMDELKKLAPSYIVIDPDTGDESCRIPVTPIIRNENGTLAMSELTNDELAFIGKMKTMKSLGTYEELFGDEPDDVRTVAKAGTNLAIYQSVYPYHIPLTYTDEEGNTIEYYRHKRIGEFA